MTILSNNLMESLLRVTAIIPLRDAKWRVEPQPFYQITSTVSYKTVVSQWAKLPKNQSVGVYF